MDLIKRKQLKNSIERILHSPGNYSGGILEMAVVIDMSLSKEEVVEYSKELVSTLKSHSEVFRNVRLNTILWKGSQEFVKEVTPLAMLSMGRFFDTYESIDVEKSCDGLFATLKKFYARSKLIIVITGPKEKLFFENKSEAKESMQPFLHKKMLVLSYDKQEMPDEESEKEADLKIITGTEIFMSSVR